MSVQNARSLLKVLEEVESTVDDFSNANISWEVKTSSEYQDLVPFLAGLRFYFNVWPRVGAMSATWIKPSAQLQQALNELQTDMENISTEMVR